MLRRGGVRAAAALRARDVDELAAEWAAGQRRDGDAIIASDRDAAKYLQDRFWAPLRRSAGRDMTGLSYARYTELRRGLLDALGKMRHHGVAGEQTYVTALGLCNKLNYRGRMAERVLAHAVADGVAVTSEMVGEVVRAAGGKEGGLALLRRALQLHNNAVTSGAVLTPLLLQGVAAALRAWGQPVDVFHGAVLLAPALLPAALPYQHLLAACATPAQARAIADEMAARRVPLDAAHHVGLLSSCVPRGDVRAAEGFLGAIPRPLLQSSHYERLLAVYKAAGAPEAAINAVLLRSRAAGFETTEGVLLAAVSAHALRGSTAAYTTYAAAPALHNVWSLFRELLTCAAVRGDAGLARRIWETRPDAGGQHAYQKSPLPLVLILRDAHYVAQFKARGLRRSGGRSAWNLMSCVASHHSVGRCSYPLVHCAASLVVAGRGGFGLRAAARQLDAARAALATHERARRAERTEHGDLHSVEVDKLLVAAAVLAKDGAFLRSRLAPRASNAAVAEPFILQGLAALGEGNGATLEWGSSSGTLDGGLPPAPPKAAATEGDDDAQITLRRSAAPHGADSAVTARAARGGTAAVPADVTLSSIIDGMLAAAVGPDQQASQAAGVHGALDAYLLDAWQEATGSEWAAQKGEA